MSASEAGPLACEISPLPGGAAGQGPACLIFCIPHSGVSWNVRLLHFFLFPEKDGWLQRCRLEKRQEGAWRETAVSKPSRSAVVPGAHRWGWWAGSVAGVSWKHPYTNVPDSSDSPSASSEHPGFRLQRGHKVGCFSIQGDSPVFSEMIATSPPTTFLRHLSQEQTSVMWVGVRKDWDLEAGVQNLGRHSWSASQERIPKQPLFAGRGSSPMSDASDGTPHLRKILVGMTEWCWGSEITHLPDGETEAQSVTEVARVLIQAQLDSSPVALHPSHPLTWKAVRRSCVGASKPQTWPLGSRSQHPLWPA